MQFFRSFGGNFRYDQEDEDSPSDEEFSSDEEPVWNPMETIDAIKNASTPQEKLTLKKTLLEQLLDQRAPAVTTKMKDFMLEEGVLESLISFLTRIDSSVEVNDTKGKPLTQRPVVTEETETAVRRSFRLMRMFEGPSKEFDNILTTKLPLILKELFKIFEHNSTGNLHHFKAILQQLLASRPQETTKQILHGELFLPMLGHLHEPAVIDAVLSFICCDFRSQQESLRFYGALAEARILESIINRITEKGGASSTYAAELLLRLIDRVCSVEPASVLFNGFAKSSKMLDKLFQAITSEDPAYTLDQKRACSLVLKELLTRGNAANTAITHELQRPLPNILAPINDKLHEYAQAHITQLCNEVAALDRLHKQGEAKPILFSSYTVERPFGFNRLIITEILSDLVATMPSCLNSFTNVTWKVLMSWFFDYPCNNIYQCHFYKLVSTAFLNNHEDSVRIILMKHKFLSLIIKALNDPKKSAAKGFMLQLCNLIRLSGDSQPPSGYIRSYLTSHEAWKLYLPTLRKETETQRRPTVEPVRRYFRGNADDDPGIDLGSAYAKSLGITATAPIEEPVATVSETKEGSQATPDSAEKKKKKKKKKKKSKSMELASPLQNGETHEESTSSESESSSSEASEPKPTETKPETNSTSPKKVIIPEPDPQEEQEEIKKSMGSLDWWATLKEELKDISE